MVYSFDPKYWNGTIFLFKEWRMEGDESEYIRNNLPIPASYFPKVLTIERASAPLPDLFHTYRDSIVVSERARVVIEKLAPRQVEFIPVTIETAPTTRQNPLIDAYYTFKDLIHTVRVTFGANLPFNLVTLEPRSRVTLRLNLASAYYFINVLGRAQRLLWRDMPTQVYPTREDGTVGHAALHDRATWKLRWRASGEPMIWHDTPWQVENSRYSHHTEIFVEDLLWQELNAKFPDQLNALRVGE
jgi:hypothetical protein